MISRREEGVSDLIGVIILVAIAALAVGIIGSTFFSYVSVVSIPRAELSIIWQNDPSEPDNPIIKPYIVFERGEPLFVRSIHLKIDGDDVIRLENKDLLKLKKNGDDQYEELPYDKNGEVEATISFSIGDTLMWDGDDQANRISITYIQAGNEILLMTGDRIPEK